MHAIRSFALVLAEILLLGIYAGAGSMNVPTENENMFLSRQKAALFEVKSIGPFSQTASQFKGIAIRQFEAVVSPRETLPIASDNRDMVLLVRQAVGIEAQSLGLQDWFPSHPGEKFVAAFDSMQPTEAAQLLPLSPGLSPEAAWQDCKAFYITMTERKTDKAEAFAGVITHQKQQLGTLFFQLLFARQREIYANAEFAASMADYLETSAIELSVRQRIILSYLDVPEMLDSRSRRLLASVILKVTLETYHSSMRSQTGPLLRRLCSLFSTDSGKLELGPQANSAANREFTASLLKDETVMDPGIKECAIRLQDAMPL